LVDETDTPFASLVAIETFLSENLGSSGGSGDGGFENRTINNRWTLASAGVYYRTRNDAWGYQLNPITISTGASTFATTPSTQLSVQNMLIQASRDSVLDKVFIDFSSIGADVTQWKVCFWMGERIESTVLSTSVINTVLLHEETITKTLVNALTGSFEISPTPITIPKGYLINVMLQRIDGTVSETNVSISTTLKHI
jgi:hypothetical protein